MALHLHCMLRGTENVEQCLSAQAIFLEDDMRSVKKLSFMIVLLGAGVSLTSCKSSGGGGGKASPQVAAPSTTLPIQQAPVAALGLDGGIYNSSDTCGILSCLQRLEFGSDGSSVGIFSPKATRAVQATYKIISDSGSESIVEIKPPLISFEGGFSFGFGKYRYTLSADKSTLTNLAKKTNVLTRGQ